MIDDDNNNVIVSNLSSFIKQIYFYNVNNSNLVFKAMLSGDLITVSLPKGTYGFYFESFKCKYYMNPSKTQTITVDTCFDDPSEYGFKMEVKSFTKNVKLNIAYNDSEDAGYLKKSEIISSYKLTKLISLG